MNKIDYLAPNHQCRSSAVKVDICQVAIVLVQERPAFCVTFARSTRFVDKAVFVTILSAHPSAGPDRNIANTRI